MHMQRLDGRPPRRQRKLGARAVPRRRHLAGPAGPGAAVARGARPPHGVDPGGRAAGGAGGAPAGRAGGAAAGRAGGGFWAYVAGTALRLVTDFELDGGLDIDNWSTTLPLKKGLSSSAASCVLVARAFSVAFQLRLSARGEMAYAYAGERETPSLCGRMRQ